MKTNIILSAKDSGLDFDLVELIKYFKEKYKPYHTLYFTAKFKEHEEIYIKLNVVKSIILVSGNGDFVSNIIENIRKWKFSMQIYLHGELFPTQSL